MAFAPVCAQVTLEELRHLERQPRRHVHAVGDVSQRPLVGCFALGQQRLPHRARDLSVQPADAVRPAGGAQRERRHVELRVAYSPRARKRPR